jgi:serine/threonine protein kinase/DNA-binding CsgD family transcriptional regulator
MIGTKLNERYEVQKLLGEGATSTVYLGLDSVLGRKVALKILHPHVRSTTHKRFLQEAMAAAQLNHPNIMGIHDRGEDDHREYLVVEYVGGDPLTHYIPTSPEKVVDLGSQIAYALHYAHENQIIHRDIKPANIQVTPEGKIKIMDLGLALPREAKRVTAPGMVIGTPAYISPEQAKGKELDHRTDIYSLGIVLYELATGQLPFNADDITALLLQHVQQPPPPPRALNENISMALENVILKTLEKDRERRFQSSKALADALQAALSGTRPSDEDDAATIPSRPKAPVPQTDSLTWMEGGPTGKVLRIVLADDHTLLRRTLSNFLGTFDDIIVVSEAGDGNEALVETLAHQPDILLLDLNMPGKTGLEALPEIREQAPDVKVLVLTGRDDDMYIMRALRSGAHGYVLKSTDEHKLVESIRKVMEGDLVLGRGVAEKVVGGMLHTDQKRFTDLEMDVLLHVAAGMENAEIAQRLNISQTQLIETNASLMDKMGVRDRTTAALKALRVGIILVEDIHDLQTKY